MKLVYHFILFSVLFLGTDLFSKDSTETSSPATPTEQTKKGSQRHLYYSASLGLGYQSLVFYESHNSAMESFLTINARVSYYPLSFLSLSYYLGIGAFSYYNADHLPQSAQINFPISVSRLNVENSLSLELYAFLNPSALMYLGVGGSYLYMSPLGDSSGSSSSSFAKPERHILALRVSLGSRFALYNHTMLGAELYVMLPFSKTRSWSNQGPSIYKQIIFGFQMDIGFFD